jgi:nicotinamidase/pyrazinamidase
MKKLLIIVDMLKDFCDEKGVLAQSNITGEYYAKPIIPVILGRVEIYRTHKNPIIWLQDRHKKNDKEFDRFPKHAVENTWGAQVIDILAPQTTKTFRPELTVYKTRYSGFYLTGLESMLFQLDPGLVEVCGVCTSICVMDTIGGLANRDYRTRVYSDCVADFDPENHIAALIRMKDLYGAEVK